jgi:serine/threonine-protein kinase
MPGQPTCPKSEELDDFATGKLADAAAHARIVSHLECCADCREFIDNLPADSLLLRARRVDRRTRAGADRNLLFGILALQMDFITRDGLIAALNGWVLERPRPLGQILVEQERLSAGRRGLIDALVEEHIEAHAQDANRSLAALPIAASDLQALTRDVVDSDVQATLAVITGRAVQENTVIRAPAEGGGRYRILRPHARGGLGEVFVAHDEELHREVALKAIQEERVHDAASRSRFVLEAEITGGLEHPGIVPVYGLGQYPDGRPYYAMRFIKGDNLKEAIERFHRDQAIQDIGERNLALRELLGRFVDVCQAVAYAHSRGVLHRDLKPGNVMLGRYGETLVVDWGLAKASVRGRNSHTKDVPEETPLFPASGSEAPPTQMGLAMGTPGFMSPEQASGRLDQLSPASDVYSLGATLYALLTGQPPFTGTDVAALLERIGKGDFLPPCQVKKNVPTALDAICRKAMALRREDRYQSALDLAADIEHWLADEAVTAYHESVTERLGRWSRRHRALIRAAAALLLTSVIALSISTYLIRQKEKTADAARKREQIARERADRNFKLAHDAVDKTMTRVAENKRLKEADFHGLRLELLKSAVPFYETFARQESDDPDLEAERGLAFHRLAFLEAELSQRNEARAAYEEAVTVFARLAADFPDVPRYRQDLALSHSNLGKLLSDLIQAPRRDDAESQFRAALDIQERLASDFPNIPEYRKDLAQSRCYLARLLFHLSRHTGPDGAEANYRTALAIQEKLAKDFPDTADYRNDLAKTYGNLSVLLTAMGRPSGPDSAESSCRAGLEIFQQLAADFPQDPEYRKDLAASHNNLGNLLNTVARLSGPDGAEAHARASLDVYEKLVADYPNVPDYRVRSAMSENNLGNRLNSLGRRVGPDSADSHHRAALVLQEKLAAEFPNIPQYTVALGGSYCNMGNTFRDDKKPDASLVWYARAIATLEPVLNKDSRLVEAREFLRNSHYSRAMALDVLGRHADAAKDWTRVTKLSEPVQQSEYEMRHADSLARTGAPDQALQIVEHELPALKNNDEALYNAACVFSLASVKSPTAAREQRAARAVELLRQAIAKGYKNVARLKTNRQLDPLRNRDDFKKLMQELK